MPTSLPGRKNQAKIRRGCEITLFLLAEFSPNTALHLTTYSVRSCVAPASGGR
jgi:hypothetical protein